jgi:hypothetical protein
MMKSRSIGLAASVLALLAQLAGAETKTGNDSKSAAVGRFMTTPLSFEENAGQAPREAKFVSHGLRHSLYLRQDGIQLETLSEQNQNKVESVVMRFVGANAAAHPEGVGQLALKSTYFIGNDPSGWLRGIANFEKVRYRQIWPGVDAVYYGNQQRLEYDFVLAPGADPRNVKVEVSGARKLTVNSNGDLALVTGTGAVIQKKPVIYQTTASGRISVPGRYVVHGRTVSFALGAYDPSRELVIDPSVGFSYARIATVGQGYVSASSVAVDPSGNAFFTGTTLSLACSGSAVTSGFVAEYSVSGGAPTGSSTTPANFTFCASANVTSNAIAVDGSDNIYLTGSVAGTGLPLAGTSAFQGYQGGQDAYLLKINLSTPSSPQIQYSTYLGGSGTDVGNAVAVDGSGNAYVGGYTTSSSFPHTSGSYAGGNDAFLAKIVTASSGAGSFGGAVLFGGSGNDSVQGVAVAAGSVYAGGSTASGNFTPLSTTGYDTFKSNSNQDGFVAAFNSGLQPVYFTFYPFGPVSALAADSGGNAYVTGSTSGTIQTNSVHQGFNPNSNAGQAFIARFNTAVNGSSSLVYASVLGGSAVSKGSGIATDGSGNATIAGSTSSNNFPVVSAIQNSFGGGQTDAFVAKFNTNASGSPSLAFSSYFGGTGTDAATAVALNPYGNPVFTGTTSSPNFPVTPGAALDGGSDSRSFASKFVLEAPPFGSLDIPTNGQTGLVGDIQVGGWALSSIPVTVQIWRNPFPGENPADIAGNGLVFEENTTFVPGTRPDVAAVYPGYLNSNAAGWGNQLLTNELPNSSGSGAIGNGTFIIHALAVDAEGLTADIGQHTITVNNASSLLPFGSIDTPTPGQTISGIFTNFGWVLTPPPANIPLNGSTITVFIDNTNPVGHPTYGFPRSDIQSLFPGYANTNTAIGYYMLDTTKLSNGLHQISWSVTDSLGHSTGIGSRYFIVNN